MLRLRLKDRLRFLGSSFFDLVYPPTCIGCDEELDRGLVCKECLKEIREEPMGLLPLEDSPLIKILYLGPYTRPLNRLIHALKYDNKRSLALILGQEMARVLKADSVMSGADYLVPIPLHPARRRERGYNQAELLARSISQCSGIPVLDCLKRHRNTRAQVGLSEGERRVNVKDAFGIKGSHNLSDRWLILVDDVLTTGATITEAAQALHSAGEPLVYGLVAARAGS